MTRRPVCIRDNALAVEALKVFDQRQIDDLIVINARREPVGLVDSQDLPVENRVALVFRPNSHENDRAVLSAFGLLPLMTSMPAPAQSPSSPLIEASVQLDPDAPNRDALPRTLPPDYHPAGGTTWPRCCFCTAPASRARIFRVWPFMGRPAW